MGESWVTNGTDIPAEGRAWQVGDRAWCDGAMWSRRSSLNETWWWSDNSDERTDAEMSAAGAVLVATTAGPVEPEPLHVEGAVRPRVLSQGAPEPRYEWVAVMYAPGDPWDYRVFRRTACVGYPDSEWTRMIATAAGRPVYVITEEPA